MDFNGKTKFFALAPSGLVVSARALRDAASSTVDDLLGEEHALADQTRVPINPRGGAGRLRDALAEERRRRRLRRGSKKKAKKHSPDENERASEAGSAAAKRPAERREWNGCDEVGNDPPGAKKYRAADHVPAGADKAAYASLFTGSEAKWEKETFLSRNAARVVGRGRRARAAGFVAS